MKKYFRPVKLHKKNLEVIENINAILLNFSDQGFTLTLRQLYYQLVKGNIIANVKAEYIKLSNIVKEGRMGGLIDWDLLEDRTRKPHILYSASSLGAALDDIYNCFKLNRQKGQEYYIEVWVEKDALVGILSRITEKYHIRLMVNRGYSSCTAMYEAYKRIKHYQTPAIIFYCGDHDPSGLDMVRDITNRLEGFGLSSVYGDIKVIHIALTSDQIKNYSLPPNPAKITDPRANKYINEHGNISWELDALTPQQLIEITENAILQYLDKEQFKTMQEKEWTAKVKLKKFINTNKK